MDFIKLEKSFTKLERQMKQIATWDKSNINPLDIDYLKRLTQQFYGELIELNTAEKTPNKEIKSKESSVQLTPTPKPTATKTPAPESPARQIQAQPVATEAEINASEPVVKKTEHINQSTIEPTQIKSTDTNTESLSRSKETKPDPVTPVVVPNDPVVVMNPSMKELFDIPTGSDLSEILRSRKIDHIGNAMGFNEKIFTINELFNGDRDRFDETIDKLNELNTFEDAKSYLVANIIGSYEWSSDKKLKNAQTFIRHISRKYQKVEV